ncbi:ABC transporter permease [Luteipulveratus sp. YIM 133132]|uniref:ABC transporter permease n=1 Tax=Luteipulveratus flavus TaxID=3031728 RepID=UPI0023AFEA9D|nr:ABC transporter permease [Luteipulveratus sp. YIM 133132]MDE9364858.1 ABC transporter permease [Luteipulveratus sp. YIM 133132]
MFLAVRDLRFAKGRFALMGAVVGLISLLVVLLTGLTAGLSRQSTSAITSLPGDRVAFSTPAAGESASYASSRLSPSARDTAARQPGVTDAASLTLAPGRVEAGGRQAAVTLFTAEPGSFVAPAGLSADRVAVGEDLARDQGLATGDTVRIGGRSYAVADVVPDASYNHTPVVWAPPSALAGTAGGGSVLVLRTGSGFDQGGFERAVGARVMTVGDSVSAVGSYTAENGSLTLMRVLLMAVSALVVGAFFTVWTIQRTPDLAVLKAIGARTGYLVRDALSQALVLLVVGGGVGTLLAAALGRLAARSVPFVVDASTTLVPLLMLVAVGLVGAAGALRRIATVDPITALGAAR